MNSFDNCLGENINQVNNGLEPSAGDLIENSELGGSPISVGAIRPTKGKRRGRHSDNTSVELKCASCDTRNRPEYVHEILRLQICGECNNRYKHAHLAGWNDQYCVLCGNGDEGLELFLCDSCPLSYCISCVRRNLGTGEVEAVRQTSPWSCYSCQPTAQFSKLKVPDDVQFYNIEAMYDSIKTTTSSTLSASDSSISDYENSSVCPKARRDGSLVVPEHLINELSPGERKFASIFFDCIDTNQISNCHIWQNFLRASDIFGSLFSISKKLRYLFKNYYYFTPGLFQTHISNDNNSSSIEDDGDFNGFSRQLYPHQFESLHRMRQMENSSTRFGVLRGGILADAPGLGKTLSMLSLCLSTLGDLPQYPQLKTDTRDFERLWADNVAAPGFLSKELLPILNKVERIIVGHGGALDRKEGRLPSLPPFKLTELHEIMRLISVSNKTFPYPKPADFENAVKLAITSSTKIFHKHVRNMALSSFKQEMIMIRSSFDKKLRRYLLTSPGKIFIKELAYKATSATIIVVPLSLLEHWFEQISRHINLKFCDESRGSSTINNNIGSKHNRGNNDSNNSFNSNSDVYILKQELESECDIPTSDVRREPQNRSGYGRYFCFIDGLGDLVDIEPPLSKLKITDNIMITQEQLSMYSFFITTFERCASLQMLRNRIQSGSVGGNNGQSPRKKRKESDEGISAKIASNSGSASSISANNVGLMYSHASLSAIIGMRWLRLIVDEGHEIGQKGNFISTLSSAFIRDICAERRWVVSGTPTTGTSSEAALMQIQRLLTFLRHGVYGRASVGEDLNGESYRRGTENEVKLGRKHARAELLDDYGDFYEKLWYKEVVAPFLLQKPAAWSNLQSILRPLLIRHTKADLKLFDPIRSQVTLDPIYIKDDNNAINSGGYYNANDDSNSNNSNNGGTNRSDSQSVSVTDTLAIDRAMAKFIADTVCQARTAYQSNRSFVPSPYKYGFSSGGSTSSGNVSVQALLRQPKAIVFSQFRNDLQGVAHYLYLDPRLGDRSICEHDGLFRSSELSRFRLSKRKYRVCLLCGHENMITSGDCCEKILLLVEYLDVDPSLNSTAIEPPPPPPPCPSGHGYRGPGGHYLGHCLCNPLGCDAPCRGLPNALAHNNADTALVSEEFIEGFYPGKRFAVGDVIFVKRQLPRIPSKNNDNLSDNNINITSGNSNSNSSSSNDSNSTSNSNTMRGSPLLWQGGVMGGRARVREWRRCGGRNRTNSWHGKGILERSDWVVENEDASILLLHEDGSHGLDLSMATHLFLLEKIKDPALENQIISRAHRMGARGPCEVILLQVNSTTSNGANS